MYNFIIDGAHLCGARGLLGWSLDQLAEASGVSKRTLVSIENTPGTSITHSTNEKLHRALNVAGVEVSEDGIRFIKRDIDKYEGVNGFQDFKMDVYNTVIDGGEVCVQNVDETLFEKWTGDQVEAHRKRMASIEKLNFKILISKNDRNIVASAYANYREIPKNLFEPIPLYLYGDKTAFIEFQDHNVEVTVVRSIGINSMFRRYFMRYWEQADPVV